MAGPRYNPDEKEFKGKQHRADQAAAAAAAAAAASTSPVGYYNAQTQLQVVRSNGEPSPLGGGTSPG